VCGGNLISILWSLKDLKQSEEGRQNGAGEKIEGVMGVTQLVSGRQECTMFLMDKETS
jgi:hypothetical protein